MKVSDLKKTIMSLMFFVLLAGGQLMATEAWKEVKSESGITIYERWVKVTNDLTVKERKGEMTLYGSMNSVINLLSDPSKAKIWMENVGDAYLIKKVSDKYWASYTFFSLPWPFENMDMVSVTHLKYTNPSSVTIEMISNEKAMPLKKNVKRLINCKATWEITDLGHGRTFVSLSTISRTSPEFPRFIQDPIVRGVFLRNMLKLKAIFCV